MLHIIGGGDVGGARTAVISVVSRMSRTIDVRLVSLREGDFADSARAAGIDVDVIETRNLPSDCRRLHRVIREFRPDILHCHGARANMMGALLKRSEKLPLVTTIHSDYRLDYLGSPLRQMTFGTINAVSLRAVDYYTCVSDRMSQIMISRGFDPQRCFAIYNGIDYDRQAPEPDRASFWRGYGYEWQESDVVCVIAARLTKVKDIPTLLRALKTASEEAPRLHLVIAGDGEDRESLETLAGSLGIRDRVTFAGWVEDMPSFFAAADINVICSLSETFPYSVSEGIREGCATVVSDVGGLAELVEHGFSGYIFRPGDDAALAKALVTLARDGNMRETFVRRLYKRASEKFSLDRMAADQISIYETVLRRFSKQGKRGGVTICGAYGKGNAGDDAILHAVINEMRMIDGDMPIRVLSKDPMRTKLDYRVDSVFTFDLPAVLRCFSRSAVYINGGGSLMQDVTSARSLWFYLWTLKAAKRRGLRVMMYGCGIGPLLRESSQRRTAKVLNECVDAITLREDDSRALLRTLGVDKPKICLAADPALTLQPAAEAELSPICGELGITPDRQYMALCLRPWPGFDVKAAVAAAEYAYRTYGWIPVLLPIELPRDAGPCREAAQALQCPYIRITRRYSAEITIGLLSRMQGVLAMRLHALIFAAAAGIPAAGISYDVKVSGFLRYLGTERFCELDRADAEVLKDLVDDMAKEDPGIVRTNTQRLLALEAVNRECAGALLNE